MKSNCLKTNTNSKNNASFALVDVMPSHSKARFACAYARLVLENRRGCSLYYYLNTKINSKNNAQAKGEAQGVAIFFVCLLSPLAFCSSCLSSCLCKSTSKGCLQLPFLVVAQPLLLLPLLLLALSLLRAKVASLVRLLLPCSATLCSSGQ